MFLLLILYKYNCEIIIESIIIKEVEELFKILVVGKNEKLRGKGKERKYCNVIF